MTFNTDVKIKFKRKGKTEIKKSDITNRLRKFARDNWLSFLCFQENRRKRQAQNGMCDYLIVGKGYLIFIESKIGKDYLSSEQFYFLRRVQEANISARDIVGVITDKNCDAVMDYLYGLFSTKLSPKPEDFADIKRHYRPKLL